MATRILATLGLSTLLTVTVGIPLNGHPIPSQQWPTLHRRNNSASGEYKSIIDNTLTSIYDEYFDSSNKMFTKTDPYSSCWQSGILLRLLNDYYDVFHVNAALPSGITGLADLVAAWDGQSTFCTESSDDILWFLAAAKYIGVSTTRTTSTVADTFWLGNCKGALTQSLASFYQNTISNALSSLVYAMSSTSTADENHSSAASRFTWMTTETGLQDSEDFLFWDGPNSDDCSVRKDSPKWTYNQGTTIEALTVLWSQSQDQTYLDAAHNIANSVISGTTLTTISSGNKILKEQKLGDEEEGCVNGNPADNGAFKGVFIRALAKLNQKSPKQEYATFISQNAVSAKNNAFISSSSTWKYSWWQSTPGQPESSCNKVEGFGTAISGIAVLLSDAELP